MRSILTEFNKRNYDWNRRMEGYEEGLGDGAHKANLETARNMLSDGLSADMIAKYTSLSLEEVTALQTEATEAIQ